MPPGVSPCAAVAFFVISGRPRWSFFDQRGQGCSHTNGWPHALNAGLRRNFNEFRSLTDQVWIQRLALLPQKRASIVIGAATRFAAINSSALTRG
jgi:hypothetical protein